MADAVDEVTKEKLKASLWFAIGKIVDEETLRLNTTATPQFIGSLTEMVWSQIENVAIDLQTFAHHASRSTITTDDVLLLTRRNEALEGIIREFIEGNKSTSAAAKTKAKAKTRVGISAAGGGKRVGGRVEKSVSKGRNGR